MTEPVWLSDDLPIFLHERLVADFGGLSGVRDLGLLESAMARPRQLHAYGRPYLVELAAAYAAGIVRNHPEIRARPEDTDLRIRELSRHHLPPLGETPR